MIVNLIKGFAKVSMPSSPEPLFDMLESGKNKNITYF